MPSTPSRTLPPVYSQGHAPGALPLLGHTLRMIRHPLAFLCSLPAYGDLVWIRTGPFPVVVVCHPELTRQLLLDDRTFDKGGPMYERFQEVIGDGLAVLPHDQHQQMRRLTQPAFHPSRFPGYLPMMSQQINRAISDWHDGQCLDVLAETLKLTTSATVETMFADALPSQKVSSTVEDLTTVFKGFYRRSLTPPLLNRLPTPGNRHYLQASTRLRQTLDRIIAERRAEGADRGDLLSALLHVRVPGSEGANETVGLTDTEISDQAVQFFVAGSETTATCLSWALHLLTQHPSVEERVRREADAVLTDGPASMEQLTGLELTHRVVTETLRLYPPAWMLTRSATTDAQLGGHRIAAKTTVAFSPYLVHRNSDVYEDPDSFDPDRWDATRRPQPSRSAFIPFGAGTRKCIGDQLGLIEVVLTLATILSRWRLEPVPGQHVRTIPSAVLNPRGLRIRVIAREQEKHL